MAMPHRTSQRRRQQLTLRDDADRCFFCRELFAFIGCAPTIDHLLPECRGGSHKLDNLVLSCPSCNRRKGSRTRDEFEASRYLERRRLQVEAQERRARFRAAHRDELLAGQ